MSDIFIEYYNYLSNQLFKIIKTWDFNLSDSY